MNAANQYITINNQQLLLEDEKNILSVARKAGIDIPTFCYHSELSLYGACRLCLVEIEGRGLMASCSVKPEPGMVVRTHTQEIRETRKTIVELLLANHDQSCPTCDRSDSCKLREMASRLGIKKVPYRATKQPKPLDEMSDCLMRDPNKCVLCGDCVRFCAEIQGIGAIDFAYRGENVIVSPAFGKSLAQVDCINCGQCAAVCPTGAIVPKNEINNAWAAINDPQKTVVVQIAPAVRIALGEMFNMDAGEMSLGKMSRALKMMGVDRVYDTSFAADLTVLEEATEFLARKEKGEKLPIFTSCCPGWVKYAEQSLPELLPNLSTCRSPQQMFGAVAKDELPQMLKCDKKDLVVIAIMPCTAKKFEARRPEFSDENGIADVDIVLTTRELGDMIKEAGIVFAEIEPESMDLPYGFATGAGVIFGNSGGVSEAVLRYAAKLNGADQPQRVDFLEVRGQDGLREAEVNIAGTTLRMAVIHGIANAKALAKRIIRGEANYDIVEVMACPGGCIGGAGQPVAKDTWTRAKRTKGLYRVEKTMPMHKAQDNPFITELYNRRLQKPGSHIAHTLLHTSYKPRKRIVTSDIELTPGVNKDALSIKVCVGTSCFMRGSQELLGQLMENVKGTGLAGKVDVCATFCSEHCEHGPTVTVGDQKIHKATLQSVLQAVQQKL